MDFDLGRVDYLNVGVTSPNALKLLPSPRGQERVVIGDQDGVLQIVSIKNEEIQVLFKTLPGKRITCLQLGGSPGTVPDKIFASFQNEVRGYTRKGKLFLAVEVSAAEFVTAMFVSGSDLIVACGRSLVHYRNLQEISNLVCEEAVTDLVAVRGINGGRLMVVVTLRGGRVLVVEHGRVSAQALAPAPVAPRRLAAGAGRVFYGADDGSVGEIDFIRSVTAASGIEGAGATQWRQLAPGAGFGRAVSLCVRRRAAQILLMVGREDGCLQIYSLEEGAEGLTLCFTYACGESLTSVESVPSWDEPGENGSEVVTVWASTYAGRVFSLRPRGDGEAAPRRPVRAGEANAEALISRRDRLRAEVAALEATVEKQRAAYRSTTRAVAGQTPSLQKGLSAPPLLALRDELSSIGSDGWHTLTLDSGTPLDTVLLQCEEPLLVKADSAAVLSMCNGGRVVALRCQADGGRLSLRLRRAAPPRRPAALDAALVPLGAPRVARLRRYSLPALADCAPAAAGAPPPGAAARARGAFSAAEVASWLAAALPPPAPRAAAQATELHRHSSLTETALKITFRKGEISFESDNPSTILILKEHLSNEARRRKINLNVSYEIDANKIIETFSKFFQKVLGGFKLRQEHRLKTALSDLINQNDLEDDSLCDEYKQVLNQTTKDDTDLDFLLDVTVDMFTDILALQGKQNKQKGLEFRELIKETRWDDILAYLESNLLDKLESEDAFDLQPAE